MLLPFLIPSRPLIRQTPFSAPIASAPIQSSSSKKSAPACGNNCVADPAAWASALDARAEAARPGSMRYLPPTSESGVPFRVLIVDGGK